MLKNRRLNLTNLFLILAGSIALLFPVAVWAANQIQNDGLEAPFVKYGTWTSSGRTFDLEVAHNWEKFYIDSGTYDNGDRLRYFRASAVEFLYGFTEKRDGADAQLYWSTKPFDAGIYQQVSGLSVGENYGFQIGTLQVFANTTSKTHNKMFRSVGIDPYGGTDPNSSDIIWGLEEGRDVAWFYPGVGAEAKSTTVTVFVRVRSIDDAPTFEENLVWVDDAFLDIAPTTNLSLNLDSATQVTASWNGAPRSGFHLYAYEAQYRREGESAWNDLQIFTSNNSPSTNTSKPFTVEPGVNYTVRARTWHEQDGGDSHEVPGPWTETTILSGGLVTGKVINNQGMPVSGATVSVSSYPLTSTTTIGDGSYQLVTGPGNFDLIANSGSGWTTPQPVNVIVPGVQATVPLSLTLRPPNDIILNGDFDSNSDNWQVNGTIPTISTTDYRTGPGSLHLSGTVTISQTGLIAGAYNPTLSFWYKLAGGDGDDTFTAQILGDGAVQVLNVDLTPSNSFTDTTVGNWRHAWLPLNLTEVYTGNVGVRFSLQQVGPTPASVLLDEVSLGQAWGGSNRVYLPVVLRD